MRFFNETPEERINKYNEFAGTIYRPINEDNDIDVGTIGISETVAGFLSGIRSKRPNSSNPVEQVADAVEKTKEVSTDAVAAPTILDVTHLSGNPLTSDNIRKSTLTTPTTPTPMMGSFLETVKRAIGGVESTENYSAHRWDTGKNRTRGSGAWGKYQFIGGIHGPDIKKVTGLGLNEFLKSPEAQEKFFEWHLEHNVMPTVKKIKTQVPDTGLTDVELAAAVHYRGPKALKDFKEGNINTPGIAGNSSNPSISQHIAKVRKYLKENPFV